MKQTQNQDEVREEFLCNKILQTIRLIVEYETIFDISRFMVTYDMKCFQ